MSKLEAVYAKTARKKRLEKELKELYRIRHEMTKLADKGSAADKQNLPFIEAGIEKAVNETKEIDSWLRTADMEMMRERQRGFVQESM